MSCAWYAMMFLLPYILMLSGVSAPSDLLGQHRSLEITVIPRYDGQLLELGVPLSAELTIDRFRFYAGPVEFLSDGNVIRPVGERYRLIDAERPESMSFSVERPSGVRVDSIRFMVGVDSLTSVSGAFGGDLDPLNGMYWTWNTGYIHLKLEGSHPRSPERGNAVELHLGGYLPPLDAYGTIALPVPKEGPAVVFIELEAFVEECIRTGTFKVMSPGPEAVKLTNLFSTCFHVAH